jgi:hypothetical protein
MAGELCYDLCMAGDPACCEGNWCAPAPSACGPIPGCTMDSECGTNQACVPVNRCAPSGCSCEADGVWTCETDCGGGLCLNRANFCPFMDFLGCESDSDCYDGYLCNLAPIGLCGPACSCDPATTTWSCDDFCAPGLCFLPD